MLNMYSAEDISKLHTVNGGCIYYDNNNLSPQDNQIIPNVSSIKTGYEIALISSTFRSIKGGNIRNTEIKKKAST